MKQPDFDDIVEARKLVSKYLPKTPLVHSWKLSNLLGCDYYIKCENLQPVGAFKVRGGVNLIGSLTEEEKKQGVISASTGNHGQSIAFAGKLFGVRVIIYAPEQNVNMLKVQAMRDLGAEVRLQGRDFDEAREAVESVAKKEGLRYIHSANEPRLIAGVGTMGLEIFDDLPDVDVVIVPVGAGSGACGNGLVAKHLSTKVKVIGVQSHQAPAAWHAWKENHLNPCSVMTCEHEGIATRIPFELTTTILRQVLDDFILVSDKHINDAIGLLSDNVKLIAEGAGAASLAAAISIRDQLKGKKVVGILSGGNITPERFAAVTSQLSH